MKLLKKAYVKLIIISFALTISFGFLCSQMLKYILDFNMKLVCDVYYEQVSLNVESDFELLKSASEYLASNNTIIEYLTEKDVESKERILKRDKVLNELKDIEKILDTISFVEAINIVSFRDDYLFSRGSRQENFKIEERPWFTENFKQNFKNNTQITLKHIDYSTGKVTISVVSPIYKKINDTQKIGTPIGAVILDIYTENLLSSIENSFYENALDAEIYDSSLYQKNLQDDKNLVTYVNKNILNNGEYFVFKFDKSALLNNEMTENYLKKMNYVFWAISFIISILLFTSIKITFRFTLKSIDKLKSILEKLDNKNYSINQKQTEFKQLETLADALNKSFDDKIRELIYYDELTKLPNRKFLEYTCKELIEKNECFALVFIDLNKFKYINDIFGHIVGDEFLIKFSQILQEITKEKGILTRYSGDEFILIYKNFKNEEELFEFYKNKIISTFSASIKINQELTTEISFSSGVAVYPKDAKTFEELINKSDFMMYINKKNLIDKKIAFFNEAMYAEILNTEKLKGELKYALENDEFYLNYQPIIDKNSNIKKAEVLIRWVSPNLGFVPPDKFIKYLEETRQIIPVGYWILENVCKNIKDFKFNEEKISISINISGIQIMLKDFVENVKNIVEKYNVDYSSLCFEITETILLDNKFFVAQNIKELQKLGVKFALDDFGTGYSSFNYLRNYDLDILKIDKSFLRNSSDLDFNIIEQIKGLSHLLNMEVVMEGVETQHQFDVMKKIGIDYVQGYFFSKPLSLQQFKDILNNKNF